MKIVTVLGARPQFIKAAAVSRALRAGANNEVLVHTGQHYDDAMSAVFFRELDIPPPRHNLGIGSAGHGVQTGRMLEALEPVLLQEAPDWVLVYGDTNSTMAGALAACKLHIPVAHVEAGLRSFDRTMPEEINRIVADHVADRLFVPTEAAVTQLFREGISGNKVRRVGDVMYDVALYYGTKAERESTVMERLGLAAGGYILATVHRAENTDRPDRLGCLLAGLAEVACQLPVVLPLHPRTRGVLDADPTLAETARALRLIEPVGYLDMLMLEKNAALVATDSGGVQKEAFFYRVPCVTLRERTEWVELVDLGWNRLVPPDSAAGVAAGVLAALGIAGAEAAPYGDGDAAERIADSLASTGCGNR